MAHVIGFHNRTELACVLAWGLGVPPIPPWNLDNRHHIPWVTVRSLAVHETGGSCICTLSRGGMSSSQPFTGHGVSPLTVITGLRALKKEILWLLWQSEIQKGVE